MARKKANEKDEVVAAQPQEFAGRVVNFNGDRFKFPAQRFWVQPVIFLDDGSEGLITNWLALDGDWCVEELFKQFKKLKIDPDDIYAATKTKTPEQYAKYIRRNLDYKLTLKLDPTIVYDYQELLSSARCPTCKDPLKWRIAPHVTNNDDKFCHADCCGIVYSMVPDKVRVVGVPSGVEKDMTDQLADDDFLQELQNL